MRRRLIPLLSSWGGALLEAVTLIGAYANDTAIRGPSLQPGDFAVDLFLGLTPKAAPGPNQWHASIREVFRQFQPQPHNVATRILVDGTPVDLIPGQRLRHTQQHVLWHEAKGLSLTTNLPAQVRHVRLSGCAGDIRAVKIWLRRNHIRMPSYVVEAAVIQALAGIDGVQPAERFWRVLRFFETEFATIRLPDPGNPENILSDVIDDATKACIGECARESLRTGVLCEVI
jgi:hypothetical protein